MAQAIACTAKNREIKADHGPERPALGAFRQSLLPNGTGGTRVKANHRHRGLERVNIRPASRAKPSRRGDEFHRLGCLSSGKNKSASLYHDPRPPPRQGGHPLMLRAPERCPVATCGPPWGICHEASLAPSPNAWRCNPRMRPRDCAACLVPPPARCPPPLFCGRRLSKHKAMAHGPVVQALGGGQHAPPPQAPLALPTLCNSSSEPGPPPQTQGYCCPLPAPADPPTHQDIPPKGEGGVAQPAPKQRQSKGTPMKPKTHVGRRSGAIPGPCPLRIGAPHAQTKVVTVQENKGTTEGGSWRRDQESQTDGSLHKNHSQHLGFCGDHTKPSATQDPTKKCGPRGAQLLEFRTSCCFTHFWGV